MEATGGRTRAWWQWAAALLVALLALHAGRVALVGAAGETQPEEVLAVWPNHPTPLFASALAGIGAAAREGRPPDARLLDLVKQGAARAPLAPEPLWVAAAARLEQGDLAATERLLKSAVRRDPRAPAGRFLLADLYIRQGRLAEALDELAALDRRVGGISAGFAPALIRYLGQPGTAAEVASVLRRNPPLRQAVLAALAADQSRSALLVALAMPGDERESWFGYSIERLLAAGDVNSARELHRKVLPGEELGATLTAWRPGPSTSPFGWRFPENRGGVAEPVAGGPVKLVHYGREETVLAEHLLLLNPGRYGLTQRFSRPVRPGSLEWRLFCVTGNRPLGFLPAVSDGPRDAALTVPPGCSAQKLRLVGRAGDIATTTEAELISVSVTPAGAIR